jgi:hypothetical protein
MPYKKPEPDMKEIASGGWQAGSGEQPPRVPFSAACVPRSFLAALRSTGTSLASAVSLHSLRSRATSAVES